MGSVLGSSKKTLHKRLKCPYEKIFDLNHGVEILLLDLGCDIVIPSPHLHASSLPPITVSLRNFRVVGCHNCAVPVIQAVTNFFTFSMDQN